MIKVGDKFKTDTGEIVFITSLEADGANYEYGDGSGDGYAGIFFLNEHFEKINSCSSTSENKGKEGIL